MTKHAEHCETVLALADAGGRVEAMCSATGLQRSQVYRILARHRPDRKRQKRRETSDVPRAIAGMFHDHKIKPKRIAELLGVSRAYVYRIIGPQRGTGDGNVDKLQTNSV